MDIHKDDGCILHGSLDAPIKVEEMRRDGVPAKYIIWEYDQMARELAHFRKEHQSLITKNQRMIDRIVARRANGEIHVFYFDVTEQLLEGGKAMMAIYEKLPPEVRAQMETGGDGPKH